MASNQTNSGDHFSEGPPETRAVVSDVPERQAVTGHNVGYVLIVGLAGTVLALAIVLVSFSH
jgi:hypothetical protein